MFQLSNFGVALNNRIATDFGEPEQFYSQAETLADQSTESTSISGEKKHLVFGYSADAPPISLERSGTPIDTDTFCGQIYNQLVQEMQSSSDYFKDYEIKTVALDSSQRFKGLIEHERLSEIFNGQGENFDRKSNDTKKNFFENNLGVECGPNSITRSRGEDLKKINGAFSEKFHTTGAKILIHKNNRHLLYEPYFFAENLISNDNIPTTIGVVGGERQGDENDGVCPTDVSQSELRSRTTTEGAVQAIYGAQAKILALRTQALDCFKKKSIIAYSSDEILLRGMLKEYANDLRGYVIEPSIAPLTYEAYGIVVYGNANSRDGLIQRINSWAKSLSDEKYIELKERELPRYSLQEQGSIVGLIWQWIESFYRSSLPLFLLRSNSFKLIVLSFVVISLSILFLSHRWVMTPVAKLFPCLFRLPTRAIEKLRVKGFEENNKSIQLLAELLRGPEQFLRETYNKSQGINNSMIDSYDVVQVLEVQVKFAKQFRPDSETEEEEVANNIAEQIKTDPHAREVVNELTRSLRTSWANQFGEQVGKESADKFMSLLSRIAEQVYRSDS